MTKIALQGKEIHTSGNLPAQDSTAANFTLVNGELTDVTLTSLGRKKKLLNIFPSLDTGVCASSVKSFNSKASSISDSIIVNISCDLPFAQARFCQEQAISSSQTLSAFRSSFAKDYGLQIIDGPLQGLCSRAVIVLDENNKVLYTQQVPEITQEPDYAKALQALRI